MSFFDDEILEINADLSDIMSDEEITDRPAKDERELANTFILKVFRKGNRPIADYYNKLIKYLVNFSKLDVRGFFFKATSCVLVEVVLNSSARNYLISIYEERLGSKVLKKKAIANIAQLCDGKFPINIGDCVMFLVILPNIESVFLPCRTSFIPYGLSNGDIMNILVGSSNISHDFSFCDLFLEIQSKFLESRNPFNGLRIENSPDEMMSYSLRIIINRQNVSDELLSKLKSVYGKVCFTSHTLHYFPVQTSGDVMNLFAAKNVADSIAFIISDDLIYTGENIFENAKNVKASKQAGDATSIVQAGNANRSSIFNRLGGKVEEKGKLQ